MRKPSSSEVADPEEPSGADGWLTRPRTSALALMAMTALAFYLCWKMMQPFVPALAWALALAILGYRLHHRLAQRMRNRNASAGLATLAMIVFIAVPVAVIAPSAASKMKDAWDNLRSESVQSKGRQRHT